MNQLPHHYTVQAAAQVDGPVTLSSSGLPTLESAPPANFGGPGNRWSPEDLLVAAVADCFCLSFRAIAAASKLNWSRLQCSVVGTLDRVERTMRFTEFHLDAQLTVPAGSDVERARHLLEKAEKSCLITNSLVSAKHLESTVTVE